MHRPFQTFLILGCLLAIVVRTPALAQTQGPVDERISDRAAALLEKMTLEEKASLASGQAFWTTEPIERLDIPSIWLADGPHGLRRTHSADDIGAGGSKPATAFPTAAGLAATWDTSLVRRVGTALGEEAQAQDVQILLGPGANIKRSPLGGRNFEYFSEDPVLSGRMAAAYIQGVQSEGVGTSLKHYAVNNQEYHRMSTSAEVDDRTLREIYLRSFEIPVEAAQPWTVMVAYNRVNGTYATENDGLLRILDEEWGHEGIAISDWGAVQNRIPAAKVGLNLEMPGNDGRDKQLAKAVQSGTLDEAVLDRRVRETLEIVLLGDSLHRPDVAFSESMQKRHHELAREAAAESFVLLKNEDDLLPLDESENDHVAIIGAFSKQPRYQGAGSSRVNPTRVSTTYDALTGVLGEENVTYTAGYSIGEDDANTDSLRSEAVEAAQSADVALVFAGLPPASETEGADRSDLEMPASHNRLIEAVAETEPSTGVVLSNGSAVAMPWRDTPKAILETWLAGQAGGAAKADVLLGRTSPSGKLSSTFPKEISDTPSFLTFPGEDREVLYGERFFVGYRYYDEKDIEPLYPFGHGLSYTTFEVNDLALDADSTSSSQGVTARVEVSNTGDRFGQEVVQLYLHDPNSRLRRPPQALRGFRKVGLDPGETETVHFALRSRDFASWDDRRNRWAVETGEYEIRIGTSSRDLPLRQSVFVEGPANDQGAVLDRHSTISQWLDDPKGRRVIQPLLKKMQAGMGGDDGEEAPGMEEIFGSLPLATLSSISGGALPEAVIDQLVQQVQQDAADGSAPSEPDN